MGRRRRGAVASSGGGRNSGVIAGFGASSGSCELGEVLSGPVVRPGCRACELLLLRACAGMQGEVQMGLVLCVSCRKKTHWGECGSCMSAQEDRARNARQRVTALMS